MRIMLKKMMNRVSNIDHACVFLQW